MCFGDQRARFHERIVGAECPEYRSALHRDAVHQLKLPLATVVWREAISTELHRRIGRRAIGQKRPDLYEATRHARRLRRQGAP